MVFKYQHGPTTGAPALGLGLGTLTACQHRAQGDVTVHVPGSPLSSGTYERVLVMPSLTNGS